jgi:hypothetical protein
MLSDREFYDWLVRIGMMPAIAERIIADSQTAELPTEAEIAEDATVTTADIELAAAWWLYTPTVPRRFKRLLHATATR